MFVGHLAVALVANPAVPRAPLGALVAGAFGLDLIWPVFLLLGVKRVRIVPGSTAFVAAIAVYLRSTAPRNAMGRWAFWALIGLTRRSGAADRGLRRPPASRLAVVALAMWLFPAWAVWIERNRALR
jgi:hypothetical protein